MENETQTINKKETPPSKTIGSVVIVGLFIALAIFLAGKKPGAPVVNNDNSFDGIEIQPTISDRHILGEESAKITIVEYTDTECPFCKNFHTTMKEIMKEYKGQVAWEYKHYPIAQLHPKAFHESEALECAWEQKNNIGFWKYVDEIYTRTESNNKLDVAELPKIAQAIGLDVALFNTCLNNGTFVNKIEADITAAQTIKIQGTPTSLLVVDGKVVDVLEGALPIEMVKEKIDKILNK